MAFYTGLSGIQSQQSGIDVTSNNIANIDTVGYKGNGLEFKSLLDKSLHNVNPNSSVNSSIGRGSSLQATPTNLKGGSFIITEKNTDLAIDGNGWFGVRGNGATMYTRDGNFGFDAQRGLVNPQGQYLLGTLASSFDSTNTLTTKNQSVELADISSQTKIKLPEVLHYPAEPSTIASFKGNLGQDNKVQKMGVSIIDKNGNKNTLALVFTKSKEQPKLGVKWDVVATVSTPGSLTRKSELLTKKSGEITFNEYGALLDSTLKDIDNEGAKVKINFGKGYSGVVSNSTATSSSSTSNGVGKGELVGYDINQNAEVVATFTNGRQVAMAKIAVYHFQNDQGLQNVGGSNFVQTGNSGEPIFYKDKDGNSILGAKVLNSKLESSNVDPAASLTDLIVYQRAYDANAKLITTSDQMIQKALQMHR